MTERDPATVSHLDPAGAGPEAKDPAEAVPVLDATELAPRCLALLDQVRRTGEEILITQRGRPLARLVPVPELLDDEDERPTWDLEAIEP